jgi:hypothetical protein
VVTDECPAIRIIVKASAPFSPNRVNAVCLNEYNTNSAGSLSLLRTWVCRWARELGNNFRVDFRGGDRPDLVLSPPVTHRRSIDDYLEYGSFFIFRNSWLLLTDTNYHNVRVKASFRFGSLAKDPGSAFFGVSLRNHHFLANWGHLVYLRADGLVLRTEPRSELGEYLDIEEGRIAGFDHRAANLIELSAEFTDDRFAFKIGNIEREFKVRDMPYVYGAGKVRLCTSQCRVQLREIELTSL